MLLLGIDRELYKNCIELFQSDNLKSYQIDDLFECNLGLNEANYGAFLKDGKRVTFLKLGSFMDDDKNMNLPIQDYNKRNILNPGFFAEKNNAETNEINEKDKTPVPIKKLLQPTDFLISIRGRIKGFSMLHTFESLGENDRLVCSNHFIHLKPRNYIISDMYMPYLHLLLDCLVKQINMDFRDKGSSSTNSLKVDELRTYSINLHLNIEEQKKVTKEYEERHLEIQQANLKYDQFMNHLSFSLLNNHK